MQLVVSCFFRAWGPAGEVVSTILTGFIAIAELQETTGYKAELWLMDLSSFASVKAFINKFNKECDRLDILVENAAIVEGFTNTADGWEIL